MKENTLKNIFVISIALILATAVVILACFGVVTGIKTESKNVCCAGYYTNNTVHAYSVPLTDDIITAEYNTKNKHGNDNDFEPYVWSEDYFRDLLNITESEQILYYAFHLRILGIDWGRVHATSFNTISPVYYTYTSPYLINDTLNRVIVGTVSVFSDGGIYIESDYVSSVKYCFSNNLYLLPAYAYLGADSKNAHFDYYWQFADLTVYTISGAYDLGYNTGFQDASNKFNNALSTTQFAVQHDVNGNLYADFSEDLASFVNIVPRFGVHAAYFPMSKAYYNSDDGGIYPIDVDMTNVTESKFYLYFNTPFELAKWQIDNPNDYLLSHVYSGEVQATLTFFNNREYLQEYVNYGLGLSDLFYNQGRNDGYYDGFNAGHNSGYGQGYADGTNDAGDYTFFSLISAVIDAPIKAFTGLFSFEILGVNIKNLLLSLFTLAVVVLIIKLVLSK